MADGPAVRVADGAPGATSADVVPDVELRTREAIVRALLADAPLTAPALAERMRLSINGVRRHLDELMAAGLVCHRETHSTGPRGRGRPARAYLLTDRARSTLPHSYDDLAIQALGLLARKAGVDAVRELARARAEQMIAPVRSELAATTDLAQRARLLARALSDHGYAASVRPVGMGAELCQHHCPVGQVATRFPQICEAEMTVFTEALGTHGQRLATIARGDSFCTTFIPVGRPPATGDRAPQAGAADTAHGSRPAARRSRTTQHQEGTS